MAVGARLLIGLLVDGISSGLILAMLGLGITLVFGLGGVLNLAIGIFSLLGIVLVMEATGLVGNVFVGVLVALVAVGLVSLAVDRSLLSLVYRSEGQERTLIGIFGTLGLAFFLEGALILRYPDVYSIPAEIELLRVAGIVIRGSSLVSIALGLVVFGLLYVFFDRTYMGQATRTVMQDEVGATLCGIDTRQLRTFVFVLSAVVAALAGMLYSFTGEVGVASSFQLTINAVIVSVVGGVTSITGTVVAGLILGIITTYADAFVGAYFAAIALFSVAIVVLLVRPGEIGA